MRFFGESGDDSSDDLIEKMNWEKVQIIRMRDMRDIRHYVHFDLRKSGNFYFCKNQFISRIFAIPDFSFEFL